jgi:hypothetical protein
LAELLLVYQWTAALCRIWPSSILDAKALSSLLSSALDSASDLVIQLPHMQAVGQAPSAVSDVRDEMQLPAADAAVASTGKPAWLAGPGTAALLEVSALVLEPLGLLLHQQLDDRGYTQPEKLSGPARHLLRGLQYSTFSLLQAMLTVCLHQLVLHTECKHGASVQQCAVSSIQHGAAISTAAECGLSSASDSRSVSRSIAELAEGYLLQHADTLQAKQPAVPNRAAVMAWRSVCERQWAAGSLPLSLLEAAAVLSSIQPTAAAAGFAGVADDAAGAAASTVWAMQDCGPLDGRFGKRAPEKLNAAVGREVSGSVSTSTGCCDGLGSARVLAVALGSGAILSIGSCTNKAAALSAVCLEVVANIPQGDITGTTQCELACTLLATAAAAVSLQGAGVLPLVKTAGQAVVVLMKATPPAQSPAVRATAEQHVQGTPASEPQLAGRSGSGATAGAQPFVGPTAAADSSPSAAVFGEKLLLCLSLAADLTKAVLQLEGDPAVAGSLELSIAKTKCADVLLALLWHLGAQKQPADAAMQQRQLQSAAYALQLVEAVIRQHAAKDKARTESHKGWLPPTFQQQQGNISSEHIKGYLAARSVVQLVSGVKDAVLGSLQAQQLLQSCTSLLLTCDSIVHNKQHAATPALLALSVQLLQLLQRSEAQAAAGRTSCGLSQSLAAGLALGGRCLMAIGMAIMPATTAGSGSSAIDEHRALIDSWLSLSDFCTPPEGSAAIQTRRVLSKEGEAEMLRSQSSKLQQAMRDLVGCVQDINFHQALQQQIAASTASSAPGEASSSHSSPSSSSSSSGRNAVMAGTLFVQMRTAELALQPALLPLYLVLAHHLPQANDSFPGPTQSWHVDEIVSWPAKLIAAGELLCAAVPNRACCSNPKCTSLSGFSAGFALVRGKGCVCGGCLGLQAGGTVAVPYDGALVAAR